MRIVQPIKTVLVITGPTGIGKTSLGEALAREFPVEIVSADSRQIYRHMDIGTAKPAPELRQKIPHHFIDILEPDQDFSAGQFGLAAREVVDQIFQRGRIPLIVGGSGLYIRALLEGFFKEDIKDLQVRKRLKQRLAEIGAEKLHEELAKVDPESAGQIHPRNTVRVIRALEVYHASGMPISRLQKIQKDPAPFAALKFGLTLERKLLYSRINNRTEQMFEKGLVDEVKKILSLGFSPQLNSLNSVGYKEVIMYLNREINLFDCKELVKRNTRRYAKRQYTWFRRESDIHWIAARSIPGVSEMVCHQLQELGILG